MNIVSLGDAVELVYGKGLPVRARQGGSVPVYGSNGVVGYHDRAVVSEPTVVVGRKGSVGAIHLVSRPSYPIDTTYFVRARPGVELDMTYASYALKHLDLSRLRTETGVPGLNRTDAYREQLPLPPLDEQRRIVGILNRAAKIERLRALAQNRLRELVPALFVNMFGDPVENPLRWEVRTLGEYCVSVQYGTSKKASELTGGTPTLRMGNITYDGYLDCEENKLKYIKLEDADLKKYELRAGDILFNRTNSKELVGKTGIWDGRFEAVPASYFIRLRVDEAVLHPTFVWACMNSSSIKRRLFDMARGAIGQANINAKEVKSILLPVPTLALQEKFANSVKTIRSATSAAESGSRIASVLTGSLMSRLLGDGG